MKKETFSFFCPAFSPLERARALALSSPVSLFLSPLPRKLLLRYSYTLGGFYLARYDDSPCGAFDELVALAGIAWDPPVSAAWAARVLVSHGEARAHGRRHCGLPSAAASFASAAGGAVTSPASPSSRAAFDFSSPSEKNLRGSSSSSSSRPHASRSSRSSRASRSCWWHPREEKGSVVVVSNEDSSGGGLWKRRRNRGGNGQSSSSSSSSEGNGRFICSLELPALPRRGGASENAFTGPRLNLKLPSFSGATAECPGLLKYACDLSARVRLVKPVVVRTGGEKAGEKDGGDSDCLSAVLGGKPLLCLEFGDMRMRVEEPQPALIGGKKKKKKMTFPFSSSPSPRGGALLA